MQFLAMLTMLIDHLGIVFFPENLWFRCIGRLAMPLYAYALTVGFGRTRHFGRYALRLAAIAAFSQLPYQYALMEADEPFELNVVFTLLVSLIVLRLIEAVDPSAGRTRNAAMASASANDPYGAAMQPASATPHAAGMPFATATDPHAAMQPASATPHAAGMPSASVADAAGQRQSGAASSLRKARVIGIAAAGCLLLELVPCDYGAHLLLLVLIYRWWTGRLALMAHFVLNLISMSLGFPPYQLFSLLSTLLVACAPKALAALDRIRVPRPLWRAFYPAHLAALAAFRLLAP
jgi:hypothetical protein